MPRLSAGLLMYRRVNSTIQVLLAHPGGPFFRSKDDGVWSIPKGEPGGDEDLFLTFGVVVGMVLSLWPARGDADLGDSPPSLYVATEGNDAWSGRLAARNADGSDGPFASLKRARDDIRRLKANGGLPAGGVLIEIMGDGGIMLSGGERTTLTPGNMLAENNHIHRYGRWNPILKYGIHVDGVGNRVAHNLIHDAPHKAMSFSGNDHVIELNEMHSVVHNAN